MTFRPSARVANLPAPATIVMAQRARALRAEGRDVISLALGEPDFPTPDHAIAAAHEAALRGDTHYPPIGGTPAFRQAVREKFARENGIEAAIEEITVANGGKQIIHNAFAATLDPGDEVIVLSPYWVSYPLIAQMLGGVAVEVGCRAEDGFLPDWSVVEAAITPRTRWLVLNFPNNPTGAVLERDGLERLAEMLRRHPHVWVLSDEIYEHLTFDGLSHVSLAAIAPDLRDRVLTLNGLSKAYAMTGWRVGYACGPAPLIAAMNAVQGNTTSGVCTVAQAAGVAALSCDQGGISAMRDAYQRRRDLVVARLSGVPGLRCAVPRGAFYVYPEIGGLLGRRTPGGRVIADDQDFALALLEEAHVSVVPGAAFGWSPAVRLSVAASDAMLEAACGRIAGFVADLA